MATANVTIHSSQFPESVRRDLLASLRQRRVNHKFHYDSIRQTRKWLALHEAHSPARTDRNCLDTYDFAFAETARTIKSQSVHVIGLPPQGETCRVHHRPPRAQAQDLAPQTGHGEDERRGSSSRNRNFWPLTISPQGTAFRR